jgi:hypothetical protein
MLARVYSSYRYTLAITYAYKILNHFWKRKSLISRAGFEYKEFYL